MTSKYNHELFLFLLYISAIEFGNDCKIFPEELEN